jgi:protein transport protein SEC61 subunit gamma-like protein
MDINLGSTDKPNENKPNEQPSHQAQPQPETKSAQPKPEIKLPIDLSKIHAPSFKMPEGGIVVYIKNKFREYGRVLKITKKPDSEEFKATVKAAGLGMIVVGVLGFIIHMIVQGIQLLRA